MKNTVSFFLCFLRPTRPPHRFNKTIIELWLTRFFSGSCLDGREGQHHRFGICTNSTIYTQLLPYFTLVLALRKFPKYVNQPICFLRWKRGLINADCTFSGNSGTLKVAFPLFSESTSVCIGDRSCKLIIIITLRNGLNFVRDVLPRSACTMYYVPVTWHGDPHHRSEKGTGKTRWVHCFGQSGQGLCD